VCHVNLLLCNFLCLFSEYFAGYTISTLPSISDLNFLLHVFLLHIQPTSLLPCLSPWVRSVRHCTHFAELKQGRLEPSWLGSVRTKGLESSSLAHSLPSTYTMFAHCSSWLVSVRKREGGPGHGW
jgi:hypothetical protein